MVCRRVPITDTLASRNDSRLSHTTGGTTAGCRLRKVETIVTRACPGTLAPIQHQFRRFYWSKTLSNAYLQCIRHHSTCTARLTLHIVPLSPEYHTRMHRTCINIAPASGLAHYPAALLNVWFDREMGKEPEMAR